MAADQAARQMSGAEMVIRALVDQGVDVIFGYPGGAVLPIYDALFKQNHVRHILVRHEQGAVHAAEGYARSTGKVGVVLVTSGPGATNAVTGLTDALMDSVPLVCLTGQVPTHLIGNDAFQEADTTGITRPCTKHNYLVKDVNRLAQVMHEAFFVARTGRPGPVVVDLPKDMLFANGTYLPPEAVPPRKSYKPQTKPDPARIEQAAALIMAATRPLFYGGGGLVNSGPRACQLFVELIKLTGFPCTLTLMGLGAFPASDKQYLGLVGMHGTFESNNAMHDCDVMINVGARFDDRVTGKVSAFSPGSKKIHVDIDPSSINKNVRVDVPLVGDAAETLTALIASLKAKGFKPDPERIAPWWKQIAAWRARNSLAYAKDDKVIKPQYAIERLYALTQGKDTYITTEVGQHQMWAAQLFKFEQAPWVTGCPPPWAYRSRIPTRW
jgi:acetolactate synthase-1/2/3 large subunit